MTSPSPEELLAALRTAAAAGALPPLLPFFGHRATGPGVGPWVLSQWWPARFTADGVAYRFAEAFMMAEKARLFGDDATLELILAATHPAQAKALGREVRGFDQAVWDARCFDIVLCGQRAKFSADERLRAFLLSTAPAVLVEASPYDRVWGIGLDGRDPRAADPRRWRGRNLLGFALTVIRDELLAA